MFIATLAGFACYYAIIMLTGILVNAKAAIGTIVTFAAICLIGAFLCRSNRLVHRLCLYLGGGSIALFVGAKFVLPLLTMKWVVIASILLGVFVYVISRRWTYRRFLRRDRQGNRPAAPFGREWVRWLFAIIL